MWFNLQMMKQQKVNDFRLVYYRTPNICSNNFAETSALIQMMKDDDWKDVVFVKPLFRSEQVQYQFESKLYFQPKQITGKPNSQSKKGSPQQQIIKLRNIVPLKRKLGEHVEKPRFLELEGYYVGKKPYVKIANINRMEHRLVTIPNQV
jgi:hypothetical protein